MLVSAVIIDLTKDVQAREFHSRLPHYGAIHGFALLRWHFDAIAQTSCSDTRGVRKSFQF
jgi:hypothetical protein